MDQYLNVYDGLYQQNYLIIIYFLIIQYDRSLVKPKKNHVPSKNMLYNFHEYDLIINNLHHFSFFVIRLYINKRTQHKIQ